MDERCEMSNEGVDWSSLGARAALQHTAVSFPRVDGDHTSSATVSSRSMLHKQLQLCLN